MAKTQLIVIIENYKTRARSSKSRELGLGYAGRGQEGRSGCV